MIRLSDLMAIIKFKIILLLLILCNTESLVFGQSFSDPVSNPFSLKPKVLRQTPCLADLDGDTDLDLISGSSTGIFHYYQNIGTQNFPKFSDPLANPFGLKNSGPFSRAVFIDLDGDDDYDLLVGSERGDLEYYQNIGTKTVPKFSNAILNPFLLNPNRKYLTPVLADIDDDKDYDLIAGTETSGIAFQENIGTAKSPKFADILFEPFSILTLGTDLIPSLADLDNDGDLDLLVANQSPSFEYFENIGTKFKPNFGASKINPFSIKPNSGDPSPFFVDLDHDGDMDMITGQTEKFNYYQNTQILNKINAIDKSYPISIFPNPANHVINFNSSELLSNSLIGLYDLNQKLISNTSINQSGSIDVQSLPEGLYYLKINHSQNIYYIKFIKH